MPIFYPIIIGFPLIYFWVSEKLKLKLDIVLISGIIIHSFLLANRFALGADLIAYKNHYEIYELGYIPFVEFRDTGYVFLVRVSTYFNLNFTAFLFAVSLFNISSLIFYLKNYPIKNKVVALTLYLLYFDLFVYSLSAIRQSIAISFLLFAIIALRKKYNFLSVILMLSGSLFHWTLLGVLPILYVCNVNKKVRPINLILLVSIVPITYFTVANSPISQLLAKINYSTNHYINNLSSERSTDLANFLISLLASLLWVLYLSFFRKMKDNGVMVLNKVNLVRDKIYLTLEEWSIIIFLILHTCTDLYYMSAIPRLEMYFYTFLPFVIVEKLNKNEGRTGVVTKIVLVLLFVFQFYIKLKLNNIHYGEARFIF